MTNNLLSLLKTEFLNRFRLGTIRNERNKKVKYRYIAMGVLYIFLAIVLAGYCFGISYGYSYLGMSYVVPGYALMITSIVILFLPFSLLLCLKFIHFLLHAQSSESGVRDALLRKMECSGRFLRF